MSTVVGFFGGEREVGRCPRGQMSGERRGVDPVSWETTATTTTTS